jgi:hypothetical protein
MKYNKCMFNKCRLDPPRVTTEKYHESSPLACKDVVKLPLSKIVIKMHASFDKYDDFAFLGTLPFNIRKQRSFEKLNNYISRVIFTGIMGDVSIVVLVTYVIVYVTT